MQGGAPPVNRLLSFIKSFFLAEDTSAELLPVHLHLFGFPNPFLPAGPEIVIIKGNLHLAGDGLAGLADQVVFLVPAVEQGRREGIEKSLPGMRSRAPQPHLVTVAAAVLSHEGCLAKEILHGVVLGFLDGETCVFGKLPQRLEPLSVFEIGVDVGVEEQPLDPARLLSEGFERVDRARRTADVKQNFHLIFWLIS